MGKKVALGCLGFALIVLVGGGLFGYIYFVKPMMSGVSTLQEIHEKNDQITNKSSFNAPQSNELTENQVDRFVDAQREIRQGLETMLTEFQEKYEDLGRELEGRDPSIREIMNAYGDLIGLYSDAKQVQVNALNNHNFSLEEYRYVQQSFYEALGVELFSYNIDQFAKAAAEGNYNINLEEFEKTQRSMNEVPARNRQLVTPYADSSEDWLMFAWWGL